VLAANTRSSRFENHILHKTNAWGWGRSGGRPTVSELRVAFNDFVAARRKSNKGPSLSLHKTRDRPAAFNFKISTPTDQP